MIAATVIGPACAILAAGFMMLANRQLRMAETTARRTEDFHRLIVRENDIAQAVNKLTVAIGQQQQALEGLHAAQHATHGALSHLLQHAEGGGSPDRPRAVVLLTLFGQPFRGDA